MALKGETAAQLVAMVSDFVPEAMAMGAMFASGEAAGPLLAVLRGLQNLPEGFNAYRELMARDGIRPQQFFGRFWRLCFSDRWRPCSATSIWRSGQRSWARSCCLPPAVFSI